MNVAERQPRVSRVCRGLRGNPRRGKAARNQDDGAPRRGFEGFSPWARYGLSTAMCLIAISGIFLGGSALAVSILVIIGTGFVLDDLIGDEHPFTDRPPTSFCNANLYLAAPLLVFLSIVHMLLVKRNGDWESGSVLEVAAARRW